MGTVNDMRVFTAAQVECSFSSECRILSTRLSTSVWKFLWFTDMGGV